MSDLVRFGVSVDNELLKKFDKHIEENKYNSRSKAIIDLIQKELLEDDKISAKEVIATLTLVFDHHKRDLTNKLTDIQHNYHSLIVSSQHLHLSHSDCMEIIIIKGQPQKAQNLVTEIKAIKGVKYASLNIAATTEK